VPILILKMFFIFGPQTPTSGSGSGNGFVKRKPVFESGNYEKIIMDAKH
jgi:hypothetical protein